MSVDITPTLPKTLNYKYEWCESPAIMETFFVTTHTSYHPEGDETICPPMTAVRLTADLRPSADGSTVEVCMGMGKTGIPMGTGVRSAMGWEWELSAWEWELRRGSCHQQL